MFTEKQKKILITIAVLSLIFSFIGIFFTSNLNTFGTMLKVFSISMPQRQFTSNTNILILGIDSDLLGTHRADSIMVANINPYTKYIGLISVPRDCRLPIEGHGQAKINHAYAWGGVKLLRNSISNYLQIPIPYYVQIDMKGVSNLVDQVGGVPINIDKRMYYVDRAGDLYIDLQPGQQILDGNKALQYIRFRSDIKADIGRIERQQTFMKAFANKILSFGGIFRTPALIFRFSKFVQTNLPGSYMVDFAMKVKEAYQMGHLDTATIPTEPAIIDGVSYLQPDWNQSQALVTRVIKGYEIYNSALPDFKKPPELTIEVLNGNGHQRMTSNAVSKLKKLGYRIGPVHNAGRFDYKESVLVNWHGERTEDEAFYLARKLYIHPDNIIHRSMANKPINFSIVLGKDWPLVR